jgi:hypothetical protein
MLFQSNPTLLILLNSVLFCFVFHLNSPFQKAADGRSIAAVTLSFMHLLLKTANHVALLLPQFTNNENQKKQAQEICAKAFELHPEFMNQASRATFQTLSEPKHCGKMKVCQHQCTISPRSSVG